MTTQNKQQLKAESMRNYRAFKRIQNIVNKQDAISLTFSFSDATLERTNENTRLQYIKRYLNAFACDYVLNKDYGKENKREHYHAIATPKYKIFLCDAYKLGNLEFKKIHKNGQYKAVNKSDKEIAKRFFNHATKDTTQHSKLIFARNNRQSESKYKNRIDAFLNRQNNYDFIIAELDEIYSGKTAIIEDISEDKTEEIKHPKQFYFIYDNDMIFKPIKNIDKNTVLYIATKYDHISGQIKQRQIIYDKNSDIYKAFINQDKNDLIIFTI